MANSDDYLNMSDEEMMASAASVEEVVQETVVEEEKPAEVTDVPVVEETEEVSDTTEEVATEEVEKEEATETTEKVEKPEVAEVDYKAEYAKIFAPFKAAGKDITIANAEDAISLMQMGADYSKKMSALKPNLKLMKLLQNNGLLSEERISYLIDLEKKNPEAISKLVKDSGLDPMDLDAEKASGYKPNTYTVDDREMELDTVLDEIQGTPSYNRTLDIVSTKWDGPSKQVIAGTPQLLKVINDHVQSGIYDTILKEVERERMFGRLNGMSDIDAYRKIGDAIQSRGGFNTVGQTAQPTPKPLAVVPKPVKLDEDKLREKKRAASSTKPAGAIATTPDYNPLSLSDAAFSKMINDKYL